MKKKYLTICIILFTMFVFACTNEEKKNVRYEDANIFGGAGELNNVNGINGIRGMYDDENVYFLYHISTAMFDSYIRFTEDNEAYINCNLASCNHSDSTCSALADWIYFRFGEELYIYGENCIKKCSTGEKVFKNCIPEEVTDDNADDEIDTIVVLNRDYAIISSSKYCYLVDAEFEIVYAYMDMGTYRWGKIYNGVFYYVNDVKQLIAVDIENGEVKPVELDVKLEQPGDDGEYIFFTTTDRSLYRYSVRTNEIKKLEEETEAFFAVENGYIYNRKSDNLCIWDYDGNLIKKIGEYTNIYPENVSIVNGTLYCLVWDLDNDRPDTVKIAVMSEDGTDYNEYYVEK